MWLITVMDLLTIGEQDDLMNPKSARWLGIMWGRQTESNH